MSDPSDEQGYTNTPGDSGLRREPSRPVDLSLDDEDIDRRIVRGKAYSGFMLAAGILWILAGVSYIGFFALSHVLTVPVALGGFWWLCQSVGAPLPHQLRRFV